MQASRNFSNRDKIWNLRLRLKAGSNSFSFNFVCCSHRSLPSLTSRSSSVFRWSFFFLLWVLHRFNNASNIFCDESKTQFCFRMRAINLLWTTIYQNTISDFSLCAFSIYLDSYSLSSLYSLDLLSSSLFCQGLGRICKSILRFVHRSSLGWNQVHPFVEYLVHCWIPRTPFTLWEVGWVPRSGVHIPVPRYSRERGEGKHRLFWPLIFHLVGSERCSLLLLCRYVSRVNLNNNWVVAWAAWTWWSRSWGWSAGGA